MEENKNEELHKIDKILTRISSILKDYTYINPTNVMEEFEKFEEAKKNNKEYSPQLKYNKLETKPLIEELEKITITDNSPIGKVFQETKEYLLKYAKAISQVGTNHFTTKDIFTPVSEELLDYAKEILVKKQPKLIPAKTDVSAKELAVRLEKEIKKYNLKGWKIEFNENTSSTVSIEGGLKKITLAPNKMYTEKRVQKLLVHEIGTHVLRAANGEQQEYKLFMDGVPGYLVTEEGLASYNEESQNLRSKQTQRSHAKRVLATYSAQKEGFIKTFNTLRPYNDSDFSTFKLVCRTKRGLGDTSKPGGFLKDHLYLEGLLKIKEFIRKGGEVQDLYAGKIRVEDIHLVKNKILKPASILPDFLE